MELTKENVIIGVVGVCTSGKSTLIAGLVKRGYHCKHIAQEHSYVADMWKRLANPHILVYLNVTYEISLTRKNLNWTRTEYEAQLNRLRNAYEHADIKMNTDDLTPDQLINEVENQIQHIINPP